MTVIAFELLGMFVRASVLWLIFGAFGAGVAIALWIAAGVLIERAVVFLFTGWRPPIGRLLLALLPGAVVAYVLRMGAHVSSDGWAAAGLIVHAAALWYLGSARPRIVDEPVDPLGL